MTQQRRPGTGPDADLLADAGDYQELHAVLAELHGLGQGPAPDPSPELAAFFKPKAVPLRRKRRGAVIGVVVAASMSLGMGAVAANEEVRENLYAAVDTAVELVQPDEPDQLTNRANDGGASDSALPPVPPVVTKPGGTEIPAEAGQRVDRSGGPLKAASTSKEPGVQGDGGGAAGGARAGGQPRAASAAPAPPAVTAGKASTVKTSVGKGQSAGQANETANGKANAKAQDKPNAKQPDKTKPAADKTKPNKPKSNKPKVDKPKVSEAVRNVTRNAGEAQKPVKRLVRRAVEGAPPSNRGPDKPAPKQAGDKPRGPAEKRSGPVKKIVEKGVDPTVERLGRTLGKVVDRD